MQTLEQVLETKTAALQEVVNDTYPDTKPACRYVVMPDGPFEIAASITGDALCALNQKGKLGYYGWPQFVDHYVPEIQRDGKWEYLDILGPVLYLGQVFDNNTCKRDKPEHTENAQIKTQN